MERAELIASLRSEATQLFETNQQIRLAAHRTTMVIFVLVVAGILVGLDAKTDDVAVVLAPAVLLLASLVFQQYAEVTVLGVARAQLEARLASELGSHVHIYETWVAPIRKQPPLVYSVRVLQALSGLVLASVVGVGTVITFEHQSLLVEIAFTIFTVGGLVSATLSYRDMLRTWTVASVTLETVAADSES